MQGNAHILASSSRHPTQVASDFYAQVPEARYIDATKSMLLLRP